MLPTKENMILIINDILDKYESSLFIKEKVRVSYDISKNECLITIGKSLSATDTHKFKISSETIVYSDSFGNTLINQITDDVFHVIKGKVTAIIEKLEKQKVINSFNNLLNILGINDDK